MAGKKLEPMKRDNGKYGYVDENENWVIDPSLMMQGILKMVLPV